MQTGYPPPPDHAAGTPSSYSLDPEDGLVETLPPSLRGALRPRLKRAFDCAVAALLLIFLAPTLGAVALLLLAGEGGPVLVGHPRIGRGGVGFHLLRFRTAAADGSLTSLGAVLRMTRIDGLPRLINVLRGEMSFVGPRAATRGDLGAMGEDAAACYLAVRPGVTGPWRLAGLGSDGDGPDADFGRMRSALDMAYVRAPSLRADLRLFMRSLATGPH